MKAHAAVDIRPVLAAAKIDVLRIEVGRRSGAGADRTAQENVLVARIVAAVRMIEEWPRAVGVGALCHNTEAGADRRIAEGALSEILLELGAEGLRTITAAQQAKPWQAYLIPSIAEHLAAELKIG